MKHGRLLSLIHEHIDTTNAEEGCSSSSEQRLSYPEATLRCVIAGCDDAAPGSIEQRKSIFDGPQKNGGD